VSAVDETKVSSILFETNERNAQDVWVERAVMNNRRAQVKIDTGARVNVMSRHHFLELGYRLSSLKQSNVILVSFNQSLVRPLGCMYIETEIRGKRLPMLFQVVPTCANVLICYRDAVRASLITPATCEDFDLWDFPDVETLSIYKKEVIHLELASDAVAKNFPTRKVPLALEDEVREELQRMEDEGVIVKENDPTDWCSPLLVRRKPNGKLRVCMDPRYLNTFLKRATYPLPDVESVFPKFRGAKFFSKLDMTAGFWQVLMDEASSKLCTFSTPFGRYRYLRLPFGISPAPEVFHRIVADVIQDLVGVMHFVDDILIWGETQQEHDERLAAVLARFKESGFTFNPVKCEFGKTEVMFLGHLVNGYEVRPNPDKVAVVRQFPVPACVEDVRRLLGVATYISKFIPRFSAKTSALRELLKADAAFLWTPRQQEALDLIKKELESEKVLYIFDPRKPTQIATDASGTGLGAVLMQNDRPIAYAARSLTPAEQNYSTIEKELLAVVFALRRFHFYTAGRPVEIRTDHQPLLGAARNVLLRDNPRLDRLFDQIIGYNLSWTYVPGRHNQLPDFLSRLPASIIPPKPVDAVTTHSLPPAHGPIYNSIQVASARDPIVDFATQCIRHGWPASRVQYPDTMRFLRPYSETLRYNNGTIVDTANRVYVPDAARPAVLQELHMGHPGKVAMLQRARRLFFWQHMTHDVEQFADNCGTCALHRPRQCTEPLQPREMPKRPGETIAADFFQLGAQRYLVLYDVFSQFPFLQLVRSEHTSELIKTCRIFFQFAGCPQFFWCDRGGAFDSREFKSFADSLGMRICHSSAEYPQSNGAAESAVKILKRLAAVSNSENELFRAILYLQNCAKRRTTASPAQIFLGRTIRTPLHPTTVQSEMKWEHHHAERTREQDIMKRFYDRTASRTADAFLPGDPVLVHNVRGKSVAGIVASQTGPRTYMVEFGNGTRSVRNRKFLTSLPRSQTPARTPEPNNEAPGMPPAIPATRFDTSPGAATRPARVSPTAQNDAPPEPTPRSPATLPAPAVRWIPRQNPMSPPRPSTTTTRSGRAVVPTLRGMNA
jgi:hypothetical protein